MSRLKRLFSKQGIRDDESGSDPNDGLVSDTAEIESSNRSARDSLSHSALEWGDWSVNGSSRDSEEFTATNDDGENPGTNSAGLRRVGSDNGISSQSSKMHDEKSKSMTEFGTLQAVKDDDAKKKKKKKISKNLPKNSSGDADSKAKKKKKRSQSEPIGDYDSASLASAELSYASAASPSTKPNGDESSVRLKEKLRKNQEDGNSVGRSPKKEKRDKDRKKEKKTRGTAEENENSIRSSRKGDDHSTEGKPPKARARSPSRSRGVIRHKSDKPLKGTKKENSRKSSTSSTDPVPSSPMGKSARSMNMKKGTSSKKIGSQHSRQAMPADLVLASPGVSPMESDGTTLTLRNGHSAETAVGGDDAEVLRLHQMLADALQKITIQSEEQIHDKDQFMKVCTELTNAKAEFESVTKVCDNVKEKLHDRENEVHNSMTKIEKLEEVILRQLDKQEQLESDLKVSEDDIDKFLIEIKDLERACDVSGGPVTDETLRTDLKKERKTLVDKQRDIEDQKSRIEHLEKELQDCATVNRIQVDELEDEKKALQGKLKGERLDLSSKLSQSEETIAELERELARYRGNSEFEEIAVVREELDKTRAEFEASTGEAEAAQKNLAKVKSDKEDLLERNSVLNEKVKVLQKSLNELKEKTKDLGGKVLKWTEQTYEWKSKAETAEKKIESLAEFEAESDTGSTDEAPQGLFLQAIMDKQEIGKRTSSRWSIFNRSEEELTPEEIRIKGLEERNQALDETIANLRSEIVKIQTAHKEEAYRTQKKIAQLEGENEAFALKNTTLEAICAEQDS